MTVLAYDSMFSVVQNEPIGKPINVKECPECAAYGRVPRCEGCNGCGEVGQCARCLDSMPADADYGLCSVCERELETADQSGEYLRVVGGR